MNGGRTTCDPTVSVGCMSACQLACLFLTLLTRLVQTCPLTEQKGTHDEQQGLVVSFLLFSFFSLAESAQVSPPPVGPDDRVPAKWEQQQQSMSAQSSITSQKEKKGKRKKAQLSRTGRSPAVIAHCLVSSAPRVIEGRWKTLEHGTAPCNRPFAGGAEPQRHVCPSVFPSPLSCLPCQPWISRCS